MIKRTPKALLATAFVVLSLGVMACGDDDNDTGAVGTAVGQAGGAESEFCSDMGELETTVSDVKNLDATSTVDEAKDAAKDVQEALDNVQDSASDAQEARVNALATAFDSLKSQIDDLSGSESLGAAMTGLRAQIDSVTTAFTALDQQASCP
ncbi:MAG TPA: hypothetical protein VIB47_00690 [Dehalococcoidia bacterium]|jgi:hypothetical protein